ncbi:DoxX family membrane protein [Neobacillus drentensis]|uniref:DoxX family membrane protein n=1 Tax=Neobacillus drentensis TaxID=220684 RepID=UPI00286A6637|nr:DoxX family membrane protein [Neobacillus drentensis]
MSLVLRYLFAVFFIYSALGYFFGFMQLPPMTGMAKELISAEVAAGLMTFVKITELVGSILLLSDLLAPLALALLAPITINILFFILMLNPSLTVLGVSMFLVHLVLVLNYRERYMLLFKKTDSSKRSQKIVA